MTDTEQAPDGMAATVVLAFEAEVIPGPRAEASETSPDEVKGDDR